MEKTFRFFRHFGVLPMLFLFLNIAYSQNCTPPTATISGTTSICSGTSTNITFNTPIQSRGARITYSITPGSTFTIDIPAGGSASINTGILSTNRTYSLEEVEYLTGGGSKCPTPLTGTAIISINPNATISNPGNKNLTTCVNSTINPINFSVGGGGTGATVSGLPSGLSGTYSSGNFTISGTPTISGNYDYYVNTTGTCVQTSQIGTITVNPDATLSNPSNKSQTVCINTSISPIIFSIGGSASGATVTGLPPGISGNISGGKLTIQGIPTVTGTYTYVVNTTGSCVQTSTSGILTSNPAAIVDAGPDIIICSNSTATLNASLSGAATSGIWTTSGTGTFSSNAKNAVYTPSSTDRSNGSVILTYTTNKPNGPCSAVSDDLVLTIQKQTLINAQPQNIRICSASNGQLSINADGNGLTYQWYKGSGNGTIINGATSSVLTFNNVKLSDQGTYYVIVNSNTVCVPIKSNEVQVTVDENITIHSQPQNKVSCEGSTTILSINASAKIGNPIYQWRKNGQLLLDNLNISGSQSSLLTIKTTSLLDQGTYDVLLTNLVGPNCHTATSTSATLSVTKSPSVNAGSEISVCENGGTVNITTGAIALDNSSIEWTSNGTGIITNRNSLTNATYTSGPGDTGLVTLTLTAFGNSPCAAKTSTKNLLITQKPIINEFYYSGSPFCKSLTSEQSVILNGKNKYGGGTFSYTTISGGPLLSLNSTTGKINPSTSSVGTYTITYATPASGGCSSVSTSTQITITKIPIAEFNYGTGSLCKGSSNPLPSYPTGGNAGIFSVTPAGLNFVSTATGEINLSSSTPGTYNITNTIAASGGCSSMSSQSQVTIHPTSVGGLVTMTINNIEEKSILLCHDATSGNNPVLKLNGHVGNIVRWEFSVNGGVLWTTINNTTATQTYTSIKETRHYRAIIKSGSCTENSSTIAIVNVIPPDIKPSPVSASPIVVCLGTNVLLTSKSGYATGSNITTGNFSDSNPDGWRINSDDKINFPANGNNTRPNIWSLTNPHDFYTQNGDLKFDSQSGKFAVVSGPNSSTMETPVFNTLGLSTAVLTFTEAYRLYSSSAQAIIELSLDGGATYNIIIRNISGVAHSGNYGSFNLNPRSVNLGDYVGLSNLRLRFKFNGPSGNVWAVDNILLPSKPTNLATEWVDIQTGQVISTSETFSVTPNRPGINTFAVTSSINGCKGGTSYIDVMAYDYNIADAGPDQIVECGKSSTNLAAKLLTAYTREPKLAAGSTGLWTVISGQPTSSYSFSNASSPNSVFNAQPGNYILAWTITKAANSPCQNSQATVNVVFSDCSGLDFDGKDDYIDLGTTYNMPYSFEAWIFPKTSDGTIISKRDAPNSGAGYELVLNAGKPTFKWNNGSVASSHSIINKNRWYHVAVSINGSEVKLYVDGIVFGASNSFNFTNSNSPLIIGANYNLVTKSTSNYFNGWIEEVRIWKSGLTEQQIRFMMNQRLYNNGANMGVQIPLPVPDGLTFEKLAGYYQLIASPSNILPGSLTANLALTGINGKLNNMESFQENTAPLPYISIIDGNSWAMRETWNTLKLQGAPNSNGIDGTTPIEWNIVKTSHNIASGGKDITVLGLISENKTLTIADPTITLPIEDNNGQMLRISHYLKLDGIIDLVGESQLLQNLGSIVDDNSKGYIERDQQGTQSSFNYNYWSSPVSTIASPNNSGYTIGNILLDGTLSNLAKPIKFATSPSAADGARTTPITISTYWLWRFHGMSDNYASWAQIKNTGKLKTGEGFTMKGTSGSAQIQDLQNYVFRGKPNNGNISLTISPYENYLIGNPYPSAMDAREFLLDNLSSKDVKLGRNTRNIINGALYFWDHFGGKTHNLKGYIGGYAVYNLSGGAPAISSDERINNNQSIGTKRPGQFIPVGQGFFVNSEDINETITGIGGEILLKNSQRIFVRELDTTSVFLKPSIVSKQKSDVRSKIRLDFTSPLGYQRQLLVTADPNTTNGFDMGYDAPMIEYNIEDMYWLIGMDPFVIQGVPHFQKDQILPLGIRIENDGVFTIQIGELVNMPSQLNIYLKDKVLDVIHDLRKAEYTSTSIAGEIDNRFEIIFFKEGVPAAEIPNEKPQPGDNLGMRARYFHDSNEIYIHNPLQTSISSIHIFDVNGRRLQSLNKIGAETEIRIPLKKYSQGVYIIKIFSADKLIRKKIIDVGKL